MLFINTSIKESNNTQRVITHAKQVCKGKQILPAIAEVPQLSLFTGSYISSVQSAPKVAQKFLEVLIAEEDHLYFVPTYYKAMPGGFKNFLDVVQISDLYHCKRIGIVSTNAKNQDYGARQFMQSLMGLLEFHNAVSVVIPQILILSPFETHAKALSDYLDYFYAFPSPKSKSLD